MTPFTAATMLSKSGTSLICNGLLLILTHLVLIIFIIIVLRCSPKLVFPILFQQYKKFVPVRKTSNGNEHKSVPRDSSMFVKCCSSLPLSSSLLNSMSLLSWEVSFLWLNTPLWDKDSALFLDKVKVSLLAQLAKSRNPLKLHDGTVSLILSLRLCKKINIQAFIISAVIVEH